MNITVAIDSLKGSLSSMEAGYAICDGIKRVHPTAKVTVKPLADGGEGTVDALIEGLGAEKIDLVVTGPLGKPVNTYYGYLNDTNTAILEMASAAGITLLKSKELNPFVTTTYGVGEMILNAIDRGARRFIIGIGGSATNDGGVGMLRALGYKFIDNSGREVRDGAIDLGLIHNIIKPKINLFKDIDFKIACDVNNPLCGSNGATYIFGPQKGLKDSELKDVDSSMNSYSQVAAKVLGKDCSNDAGCGAAGGLGFAFKAFLDAALTPGIELLLNLINLEQYIIGSDIVITGEGRLDHQTAMGKAPIGVAKLAKKHNAGVIAFAGSVTHDANACNDEGIDAFFPILRSICTLDEAMDNNNAKRNMTDTVEQVFRLVKIG
ncbi:MAG: glycerate kinase [Suipraeoptans sp.]